MYYRERQDVLPDKDGNLLWRPEFVRSKRVIDAREMARILSTATTLTVSEIFAVLMILPEFMNLFLREGHTVKLDGLGTFILYGRSRGKGVATREEVKPSQFNNIVCKFTPEYTVLANGTRSSELINKIEFIHIDRLAKGSSTNSNDDDDGWRDPNA